jgi:hypothetical protein
MEVTDLYLAGYFQAAGVLLLRTERLNERRVGFVFQLASDDEAAELERQYLSGDKTSAIGFANSIKHLKQLVTLTRKRSIQTPVILDRR